MKYFAHIEVEFEAESEEKDEILEHITDVLKAIPIINDAQVYNSEEL